MRNLFENWRRFVNEITTLDSGISQGFQRAVESSQFWTMPHSQEDVDLSEIPSDQEDPLTTPAAEALMTSLNQKAQELETELYFIVTVSDQYPLSKKDPHGGYPNNWMKHAMYQGPLDNLHVIWIELRPLAEDYDLSNLDPSELIAKVSRTINHEMVHYHQLKKQATSKGISDEQAWEEMLADPRQLPKSLERTVYLSRHPEIDAYAHEAAEELVSAHGVNGALELIKRRDSEATGVLDDYRKVFKDDSEVMNKFLKKGLFANNAESTMKQIMENWRRGLNEEEALPTFDKLSPEEQSALETLVGFVAALQAAVEAAAEPIEEARPGTPQSRRRSRRRRKREAYEAWRKKIDDYASRQGASLAGLKKADMTSEQLKVYDEAVEFLDPATALKLAAVRNPLELPGVEQIIKFTKTEKLLNWIATTFCGSMGSELDMTCIVNYMSGQAQG